MLWQGKSFWQKVFRMVTTERVSRDWVGRIERETVLNNSGSRLFEVGFTVASSFHDGEVGEESRDGVNVFTESA
jgi:hypothetical protein